MSSILGSGCPSSTVASFSFRKSSTNRYSPGFFLGTGNEGLLHGLTPGSILPSSMISSVNLTHAAFLSPWIWNMRCLTGTASFFRMISASPCGPLIGWSPPTLVWNTEPAYPSRRRFRAFSTAGVSYGSRASMAPFTIPIFLTDFPPFCRIRSSIYSSSFSDKLCPS